MRPGAVNDKRRIHTQGRPGDGPGDLVAPGIESKNMRKMWRQRSLLAK